MYTHALYHIEAFHTGFRTYLVFLVISQFFGGVLFVIASFSNHFHQFQMYLLLWILAILVEKTFMNALFVITHKSLFNKSGRVAQHFEHMVRRHSNFILLICGEAILQLVESLTDFETNGYARQCVGFTIVYMVGIIYYEQQQVCFKYPYNVKETSWGYVFEELHVLLSLSILFFAVGMKLVFHNSSHSRNLAQEFLMTVSVATSLVVIYILRYIHKGVNNQGGPTIKAGLGFYTRFFAYSIRFSISIFIAFIPYMLNESIQCVILVCVLTIFLVLLVSLTQIYK